MNPEPAQFADIERVVARARRRLRVQAALEGATTATILAAATALVAVFAMRAQLIGATAGLGLLLAAGAMIAAGAVLGAARRLDDEAVARRIDRASGLADRLATAIAFRRDLATGATVATTDDPDASRALMAAAIRDGVRAVPRANVRAAAPFTPPRDGRVALGFLAVSALAAGLAIPTADRRPHFHRAEPELAPPGAKVALIGEHLGRGDGGRVLLGDRPIEVVAWSDARIDVVIPADAALGTSTLLAQRGRDAIGPIAFTVVDPKDARFHDAAAVQLDPDERAYVDGILADLIQLAKQDRVEELEEFAKRIEQLLADAEQGKITKEKLLEELAKAEAEMNRGAEPDQAEVDKQLAELGKQLAKDQVTAELGKALEKADLAKAQQELERLANKLDPQAQAEQQKALEKQLENKDLTEQQRKELQQKLDQLKQDKPLTEAQKDQLQKQLEKTAEQMKQQAAQQKQNQATQQQKLEQEIRRLQKQKDDAKTPEEQLDAERRLQKKQDEVKQLQKKDDDKAQSAQREAVKRLQKDLEQAADSLQKPEKQDGQDKESDEDKEQRERQASQKIKDAARETGRVDQDKRKQAAQKKTSTQMEDLKEAMQRAKQKGNKGPQDPFNKQGKNQDFAQRARGGRGSGQAWRPGQGQGQGQPGQGQGNQPGQPGGNQPGQGSEPGVGHDPNLVGDSTAKSGNTKDVDLQGRQGGRGTSRRETILSAAQKGFATRGYQQVYAEYEKIVEEVMRNEKLPSSYKYYVKRYFAKIHPSAGNPVETGKETQE